MNPHRFTPKMAVLFFSLCAIPAEAVILYGAGNDSNLTNPGTGLPFDVVARLSSTAGAENGGSGVHLGGGYMLTAAHISNTEIATVTFDGSTFYSRDLSYSPIQIGTADLKLFRLSSVPTVGAANIYTGSAELLNGGALVGWGRGRVEGSSLNTNTVPIAGGGTPLLKRWGTNDPTRSIDGFYYSTYAFDALETVLGNVTGNPNNPNGTGAFEAAATPRDSGGGYFQQIDGIWYLTGIASVILQQNSGNATYGTDVAWSGTTPGAFSAPGGTGDPNIYVRVSSYADQLYAVIPEPQVAGLLLLALAACGLRRHRCGGPEN